MPTLKQLIEERVERLDSVPASLLSDIDKQNEKVYKQVLKLLGELEVKDGKLVTSTANLAKVTGIINQLKELYLDKDYIDAIKSFAGEIATQATLNNKILQDTVDSFSDEELFKRTTQKAQENALRLLDQSAVENNLVQPISEILNNAVINNLSFVDATELLRQNMTGESAIYAKYANTYIKDAFSTADRQYVQLTARENGIEFYRYSGGVVSDSRVFCEERNNKVFHEAEIRAWGDMKKTRSEFTRPTSSPIYTTKGGVKIYWEGMNYDTTSSTIFSYIGGYQCNHVLVPIATEYVPKTDKLRAKELGFYQGEV